MPAIETLLQNAANKPRLYGVDPRWRYISSVGINGLPIPQYILELMADARWVDRELAAFPHNEFASERELYLYGL